MTYTEESYFIGYEPLNIDHLVNKFSNIPYAYYLPDAWREIFGYYDSLCYSMDLNPMLLVAQMAHETSYGRSWWSIRPRRNPAGILVTGQMKQFLNPDDIIREWQYSSEERMYKRGYAFSSWRQSTYAHVGHLLNYIYKDSEMSSEQYRVSTYLPTSKSRLDSAGYRGVAKQLSGLNGRWATGNRYAAGIARVANEIVST